MVTKFEDLIAWQKSRLQVSELYREFQGQPACKDFEFCRQIRAAALSVMSNIAEGFERKGNNEFRHFLSQAGSSNGELRSQLYVALDIGYLTQDRFDTLFALNGEVGRLTTALRQSLR